MSSVMDVQYCYPSLNDSCIRRSRTIITHIALYISAMIFVTITVCGNLAVIISISHFKQLHCPNNVLVCSLAVVDFLVGFIIMPYSMVRTIESCWYFGDRFCKIHSSFDVMFCTSSIFHLCFIAVDRHYAVCDPLHYYSKITFTAVALFVAVSWAIPSLLAFGIVLSGICLTGIADYMTSISCVGLCVLVLDKLWTVLSVFVAFIIPTIVMVCIYIKIFIVAKRHVRVINNMVESIKSSKLQISSKNERKAAKTLSIVMGAFILCWLPYFVAMSFDPFLNYATPVVLFDVFMWLAYSNSGFNPIIYGFFYPWFQKALHAILSGKIFCHNSSAMNLFLETH
ncbi:trace amine-associated receptor 4-like [Protopterus annectens]|uniref:trace amine-associated receptor 4-like n=1 Tax=Protopterus annectens TaxID=7888 RepID=UPI001CFC157B|nr:trace amine-associated receptor 4-like [Protopterus annectens]